MAELTVAEAIKLLSTMPQDARILLLNPDAKTMCDIKSPLAEVRLDKFERLSPNSYGCQVGDPRAQFDWIKQVVLVSQAHQRRT